MTKANLMMFAALCAAGISAADAQPLAVVATESESPVSGAAFYSSPQFIVYPDRIERGGKIGERGELIVETDIMLGALVEKLKQRGILDNTLIVFTSDNGGMGDSACIEAGHRFAGPWSGGKGSIFEGGHRVPFIIRFPAGGVKAGVVDATPVGLVDWFPSVAHGIAPEQAGTLPPLDGEDRSALFAGKPLLERKRPLIQSGTTKVIGAAYPHPLLNGKTASCRAITVDGKKLVLDLNGSPRWLFDLKADPGETRNVLDQYPELSKTLAQQYREAVEAVPERGAAAVLKVAPALHDVSPKPVDLSDPKPL